MRPALICMACSLAFPTGEVIAQSPAFRTETSVVQVPVGVTAGNGRDVEGLQAGDFTLRDNGVAREITLDVFGAGAAPISFVIAVQSSGISTPALKKIQRIGSMIQPLVIGTRGEAAVVTFDSEINWVQDFTGDPTAIRNAFADLKPFKSAQSRLYDAIAEVADHMKDRKGRKVLLLISESRDRSSTIKFEEAMDAIQREGVEVFAAHYSAAATAFASKPTDLQQIHDAPIPSIDGPDGPPTASILQILPELFRLAQTNAVAALTQATGGSDYPFLKERGIENAIEKLGVEVHSQYILNFPLPPGARGTHKIEVLLPDHADYRIRARQAYRAQ
jgi:VWFA-related protein